MALQRIGGKVDEQTLAHILRYYGRFGDRQAQIAAYERRKARQARGVSNLSHASHQQVRALAEAGLIGAQPQTPIGSPVASGLPNQGNAFGAGSVKVPAGMIEAQGKGGPAGGRPIAGPVVPGVPQLTPTGLAGMLAAPSRPRKRVRNQGFGY